MRIVIVSALFLIFIVLSVSITPSLMPSKNADAASKSVDIEKMPISGDDENSGGHITDAVTPSPNGALMENAHGNTEALSTDSQNTEVMGTEALEAVATPSTEEEASEGVEFTPSPTDGEALQSGGGETNQDANSDSEPDEMGMKNVLEGVVIGVDPGHQQHGNSEKEPVAPGSEELKKKVSSGTQGIATRVPEHEVNLAVGLILRDLLEQAGATVYMTRETADVDISNVERAEFFNDHKVELGIRLHCNGSNDQSVTGAFMLVPASKSYPYYEENIRAAELILKA